VCSEFNKKNVLRRGTRRTTAARALFLFWQRESDGRVVVSDSSRELLVLPSSHQVRWLVAAVTMVRSDGWLARLKLLLLNSSPAQDASHVGRQPYFCNRRASLVNQSVCNHPSTGYVTTRNWETLPFFF